MTSTFKWSAGSRAVVAESERIARARRANDTIAAEMSTPEFARAVEQAARVNVPGGGGFHRVLVFCENDCDGWITRYYRVRNVPSGIANDYNAVEAFARDTEQITGMTGDVCDIVPELPADVWNAMSDFSRDYWMRVGFHTPSMEESR